MKKRIKTFAIQANEEATKQRQQIISDLKSIYKDYQPASEAKRQEKPDHLARNVSPNSGEDKAFTGKEKKLGYEEYINKLKQVTVLEYDEADELLLELGDIFLFHAESNDRDAVIVFLKAGMPITYQDPRTGQTALHMAAASRAWYVVKYIAEQDDYEFLIRDHQGRLASEMAFLFGNDPDYAGYLMMKEKRKGEALGIKVTKRP